MEFSFLTKILVLTINAVGIWLAVLVARRKAKTKVSFLFALMVFLMLIWVNFAFLARVSPSVYSLLFIRLAWAITPLFFVTIFLFIRRFSFDKKKYSPLEKILVVIGIINIPFVFITPWVIRSIRFDQVGILRINYGMLVWVFFGEVFFFTVISFYTLFKGYTKHGTKEQKAKTAYLLASLAFFFIMNSIFNIIFPVFFKIFHIYEFGDYSTIILISVIAYAIMKEKLFGIKVIFSHILVGLITILLLLNVLVAEDLFGYLWRGGLFVAFLALGVLLVKSVKKEVKQKEELDKIAWELSSTNVKLEGAYEKLKKLDKAKSEFISIASHQLRTPLTAIKGYVSMFLERDYGPLSKEITPPMHNVYESNERLVKLVNSLLNLSRLEAGRIVIEKTKFSMERLITSLVQSFATQLRGKPIELKFQKPKTKIPDIYVDKEKVTEVISNLFDNAIKYTPKGNIVANLEYKKSENKILITVSDTGEGMSKEEITKLFKSFSRAGAGNKHWTDGAGLGLYVAKRFITMHKGKIWAESPGKGHGSTFLIELPVK